MNTVVHRYSFYAFILFLFLCDPKEIVNKTWFRKMLADRYNVVYNARLTELRCSEIMEERTIFAQQLQNW